MPRLDSERNGDVIAEVVHGEEPRWLGHHFPHSDILWAADLATSAD